MDAIYSYLLSTLTFLIAVIAPLSSSATNPAEPGEPERIELRATPVVHDPNASDLAGQIVVKPRMLCIKAFNTRTPRLFRPYNRFYVDDMDTGINEMLEENGFRLYDVIRIQYQWNNWKFRLTRLTASSLRVRVSITF